jgi:hypothetical protein
MFQQQLEHYNLLLSHAKSTIAHMFMRRHHFDVQHTSSLYSRPS